MITILLGNRIQDLRKQTGISQEKFALQIGMDRTYFASVEAGKRNIAIRNIKKIADGFGISLSELFYNLYQEVLSCFMKKEVLCLKIIHAQKIFLYLTQI